jgi:hypothetical protein
MIPRTRQFVFVACIACLIGAGPPGCSNRGGDEGREPDMTTRSTRPANRLVNETSPYLLQHAHNPVDWYPWGEEAFAAAGEQGKPVFLSVGYSTCHWCHVMERESFENEDIAAILNEHFIAIKVDREQRPDIDQIYMNATQLLTGQGGWPNSVWLTPEGKPWFAGTYFPAESRPGMPGFGEVLTRLAEVWREQPEQVREQADRLSEALARMARGEGLDLGTARLSPALVEGGLTGLGRDFDPRHGGFGGAPKFPPHGPLRLILQVAGRDDRPDELAMATRTLAAIARGGIRDHVGGGFHRYSTDERWFLPHFEKMLYDNAQLARVYVDAWRQTGREDFRRAAEGIFAWVAREMTDPAGGFYSAIDADSEGVEGKFYLWTRREVLDVLGPEDGELIAGVYGLTDEGNYREEATGRPTGTNILHLERPLSEVAEAEDAEPGEFRERIDAALARLCEARDRRIPPHKDDKVLAGWNGLMIGALAHAGRHLDRPAYVRRAEKAAGFVLDAMRADGRLKRSWRAGQGSGEAFLDDYAFLADGLLDLHAATGEARWLDEAGALMAVLDEHYRDDSAGGYFFTSADGQKLLARTKDPFDSAVPAGNAVAARVWVRLADASGGQAGLERAWEMLKAFAPFMARAPQASATMLAAADACLARTAEAGGGAEKARVGEAEPLARSAIEPVTVEAFGDRAAVTPGAVATIHLRLRLEAGWHVAAARPGVEHVEPLAVTVEGEAVREVQVEYPGGQRVRLGPDTVAIYGNEAAIPVRVTGADDATPGEHTVRVKLICQPCDDRRCLAAQTHALDIPLKVAGP